MSELGTIIEIGCGILALYINYRVCKLAVKDALKEMHIGHEEEKPKKENEYSNLYP